MGQRLVPSTATDETNTKIACEALLGRRSYGGSHRGMDPSGDKKKDFTFIRYDRARVPKSDEARRLIRQHAMSDVAATRRQKGNYYRIVPNHAAPQATEEERVSEDLADAESFAPGFNAWQEDVRLYQRPTDEEQRFLLGRFPILQLIAPLTSLHLGIATISCFTSRTALIGDVLTKSPLPSLQSRKLLSHIPSRYGKIPCLTYTVDCLVAKLEQIIDPSQQALPDSTSSPIACGNTLQLYGKALQAVQAAIEDETVCLSAETLCALKLLQVFELLNQNPNPDPWVYHAGGAAKLIQLRGPGRFQTDFELALFMSLCGSIATEAFLSNKPCFLASGPWLQVIFTAIHDNPSIPSDQSQLLHELWSHLISGPTIFQMVTDIVLSPSPASMEVIEDAISSVQQSLDHLHMWAEWLRERQSPNENDPAVLTATSNARGESFDVTQRLPWRMLQGTHNMCLMLKRRMLTSLAPLRFRRIEAQCQALAEAVVSGSMIPSSDGVEQLPNGLYMAQTAWVAKSILETRSMWCNDGPSRSLVITTQGKEGVIGKAAFEAWCKALGRKTT